MKGKALILLSALLFALGIKAHCPADSTQHHRKKVAVVLSGGGAKGTAHIGALKVIERAGIPIDIITGTSMGSLIGGLYAIGYDAAALDSLVRMQDWNTLLSDKVNTKGQSLAERDRQNTYLLSRPLTIRRRERQGAGGIIVGTNLDKLFARLTVGYHDSISFSKLPIPFACVATNIIDNTEYDFHSGRLHTAMRASMAIPGVFTPVRIDSMLLVDGGLRNNYPADIARQMGADIIIGVSWKSKNKTADELQSGANIIMQIIDINCRNKLDENLAMTDVPILVDVEGYSSASFTRTAIDSLINRGEAAAMQQWDRLMEIKRMLGADTITHKGTGRTVSNGSDHFYVSIGSITSSGIEPKDLQFVCSKFALRTNDSVSTKQIEEAVTALQANMLYTKVGYTLNKTNNMYALHLSAGARRDSRINLGVRFDTEETVALQANMQHQLRTKVPVTLEFTGRLGKRIMARLDADIIPLHYNRMGLSYTFRRNDINIYQHGDRDYNFTYNQHTVNLQPLNFNVRNFALDINVRLNFYNFEDVLIGQLSKQSLIDDLHLYSYIINLRYDSEDHHFFTTRGAKFDAGYGYHTDNFIDRGKHAGISEAYFSWRMAFMLTPRLSLQPMVYGRMVAGTDIPLIMHNAVGGMWQGHYIEQQMPFDGIGYVEFIDNTLLAVRLRAMQRIMDNNYVLGSLSLAQRSGKLRNLLDHGPMTGFALGYCYNTMFGPIGATMGYASRTEQMYFYINLGFRF